MTNSYRQNNILAFSTQNLLGVMQGEDFEQTTGQNMMAKSIDSNQLSKIIR